MADLCLLLIEGKISSGEGRFSSQDDEYVVKQWVVSSGDSRDKSEKAAPTSGKGPSAGELDISEQKAAPTIGKSSSKSEPDKSEKAAPQELDEGYNG